MFPFFAESWVPKFILNDQNGYALAKAIEVALQSMNNTVETGVKLITDVDTMPEWRLDELAWEYNILYDYTQDVETKREWIKNARSLYSIYGTAKIIKTYLEAVFGENTVAVEEWNQYGGDPYHFRVVVNAEDTTANRDWAENAIAKVKNVRSILDTITFTG